MPTKIFVNLAVKDLPRSMEFFKRLGYTFNPQFSNQDGACMVISDTIYSMLLTPELFQSFASKPMADAKTSTEMLLSLSLDSRDAVTQMVENARAAGATVPKPPTDHGFMLEWGFEDLDGHTWTYFWMDPAHIQPPPA